MSYIVTAGTPHLRYTDPQVTGAASPYGLYSWSTLYAPLTHIEPGKGTPPVSSLLASVGAEIQAQQISLLLFTADLPVIAQAYVRGQATAHYNVQPIENLLNLPIDFVGDAPSGFIGGVSVPNYGEVLKGFTAPIGPVDGVAVSGFPARIYDPVSPPYSNTVFVEGFFGTIQPDAIDSLAVLCIVNSGSVAGVIGPMFCSLDNTAISGAPTAIILRSSQYTQQIKDNGNLCVTENGDQGQVVGLYYIS